MKYASSFYALSERMLKIFPSYNTSKKHCRRDVLGSPGLHKYLLPRFPFFLFFSFFSIRDLYLENLFIESYLFIKTRIHSGVPRAYRSVRIFVDLDLIGNSILPFSNPPL